MMLELLLAEREIHRQLIRFARAMDQRDWSALAGITTADIVSDFGLGELQGGAALEACLRSFLDGCGPTQHLLGNVLIDIEGDRATSRSYVSDLHVGLGDQAQTTFRTLGDYHDQWVFQGGGWLISKRVKHNRAVLGDMSILGPG